MPTSKLGTWIYERGTVTGGGGDGTGAIPDAPPVTIDTDGSGNPDVAVEDKMDGTVEVAIYWHPDPSATTANFTGVQVFLEDPDISDKPAPHLAGGTQLNDTTQQSGAWKPVHKTDSFES